MNKVFEEIVNKGEEPTRSDIARLLTSIAEPRFKRDEKRSAVQKLYEELGYSGLNIQGHAVWNDLNDFGGY